MAETVKWGIMGSGNIIDRWIKGAMQCKDMEIVAISSRSKEHAQKKADLYQIPKVTTYEDIVKDPTIEVMYIAALHTAHKDLAIMAMEHGKSVLVEKPAGVNEAELQEMLACAKKNHVFFMEAVWTRFFPLTKRLKEELAKGVIGEVRKMHMSFSFRNPADDLTVRLLNPELAGGGLLDTGVYNLHFTNEVLEKNPVKLIGLATIDSDEYHIQVDEQASYIAQYDQGELVTMDSGVRTTMIDTAILYGTEGYIVVPGFWKPQEMKVVKNGKVELIEVPVEQAVDGVYDEGYQYEIKHVNACIKEGKKESPVMTWQKSIDIAKQCDELRKQWGLVYPFEK